MKRVLCPGSFDPVTHGHVDVILRAAALFDQVIVGVGTNTSKNSMFGPPERVEMLAAVFAGEPGISVLPITGLLVDFCRAHEVSAIVKGLRFASDFDNELAQAQMNRKLSGIETILMPTAAEWAFVSSTLIREIAINGGDITGFVPVVVARRIADRLAPTTTEGDR